MELVKRNKKKLTILAVIIILVVIFVNLSKIVTLFFPKEMKLTEVNFNELETNANAYGVLSTYTYDVFDIKEPLRCTGWAFVESEEEVEKRIRLVFKGNEKAYISEDCSISAGTLSEAELSWKKIPSRQVHFSIELSTVNLPDGAYDIYIYVENETAKGMFHSARSIYKDGINVSNYAAGEQVSNFDEEMIDNNVSYGWSILNYEGGCVLLEGCQVVEGYESEKATYYLEFVGNNGEVSTIRVPQITQTALADVLGDVKYVQSGFNGGLPYDKLPDKEGQIFVIMEANNHLYISDGDLYSIPE